MPIVTALRATRSGGVALHVDGDYVCAVSASLLARWRLFKGRELSADDVAAIAAASSQERVAADAYRLLGHRARGTEELRRRLLARGHDEAAVAQALDRLTAEGLLDDVDFARSYAADKRRLGGWGAERIRRGLSALGVRTAVIDAVVGEGPADDDAELERALNLLRKRGASDQPVDAASRRRAYQALLRRGFASAVAYRAIALWSGERSQR